MNSRHWLRSLFHLENKADNLVKEETKNQINMDNVDLEKINKIEAYLASLPRTPIGVYTFVNPFTGERMRMGDSRWRVYEGLNADEKQVLFALERRRSVQEGIDEGRRIEVASKPEKHI